MSMRGGDWERAGGRPLVGDVVYEASAKLAFSSTGQSGRGAVAISLGVTGAQLKWTMAGSFGRRGLEGSVPIVPEVIERVRVSPGRGRQRDLVFIPVSGGVVQIEVASPSNLLTALKGAPSKVPEDPFRAEYERIMADAEPEQDAVEIDSGGPISSTTQELAPAQTTYAGVTDLIGLPWLVELVDGLIIRAVELSHWDDDVLRSFMNADNELDPAKCSKYLDESYESAEEAEDALWGLRACEEGLPYRVRPAVDG